MSRRDLALVAVAVVAVSFSSVLVRLADAPALAVAFYRCAMASVVLVPIAVVRHRPALTQLGRRDRVLLAASGLALAAHFATWISSLSFTTVAASAVLVQTAPLWVAAFGRFVGERPSRGALAGIGVALAGTLLISAGGLDGGSRALLGDLLALAGAAFAAAYVLLGRAVRQRLPVVPYTAVVYAVSGAALAVAMVVTRTPFTGYEPRVWLLFAAITAGPQFLGHTVFNYLLGHVRASVVSVALLAEPVGATVLAFVLLDEVPSAATVVGGAVILIGVYLAIRAESRAATDLAVAPVD